MKGGFVMSKVNPFQIKTPESLTPEETISLFVDEYTDFPKITAQGHTFIMGPRGIGKSMIFRYLQPDCQCKKSQSIDSLEFLGLYIPLRNAGFTKIIELTRLERNASHILNEHIMVTYFMHKCFASLSNPELYSVSDNLNAESTTYFNRIFIPRLSVAEENTFAIDEGSTIPSVFKKMSNIMENFYLQAISYTKKLAFSKDIPIYNGPLYDYLDFVVPLISSLSTISCFPQKTIFLLIDDAHTLTSIQTQILNFWVSTRTSGEISLKISSQYNYKHFYTVTGATIDTPHDYSEIDMSTVYTGRAKSKYYERITEIIDKRLKNVGIIKSAKEFFPEDAEQEEAIKKIGEEYNKLFDEGKGRGNRRGDDALRYSRPDYIKNLLGTSKSGHSYSYAGFDQLVHLSSGIVRYFLEPAYKMYGEEISKLEGTDVAEISPSVQSSVIRDEANNFLFHDLQKYAYSETFSEETQMPEEIYPVEEIDKLSNLIQALGGLFHQVLISDRSERRVYSIAISDTISKDVDSILKLGIQLGYFHQSTIGRKDGKSGGRTKLYILNRRLAPIWTLDPTGFAGYLFVQNQLIEEAMREPFSLLRRLGSNQEQNNEYFQLSLFNIDPESQDLIVAGGDE